MTRALKLLSLCGVFVYSVLALAPNPAISGGAGAHDDHSAHEEEYEKGPNGGRILESESFEIELVLFEGGVYPEYRIFAYDDGEAISPENVQVRIELHRLKHVDEIIFTPEDTYLKGNLEIYEPHSFEVHIAATYLDVAYDWHFESFEGRTAIPNEVAKSMGVTTALVGEGELEETVYAWGRVVSTAQSHQDITARFDGVVRKLHVDLGDKVKAGDALLDIESNESLKNYTVKSPISGVIDELYTSEGVNTQGKLLMTVMDLSKSVVELDVFENNRGKIKIGQRVKVKFSDEAEPVQGEVYYIASKMNPNQSFSVRARVDQAPQHYPPGYFASADIILSTFPVEKAVKKSGLQKFRDFTVVYTKYGETYEVRMLDLGRESGEWVEVLGGIESGEEYVVDNSYIIKADIEKSGASHDH